MADRDIMPFISQSGQTVDIQYFPMNAAETFRVGEPVAVNAAGDLTESATDAALVDFIGIAMEPVTYSIGGTATTKNPRTGAAYATGASIAVAMARPGVRFITAPSRFSTGGGGVAVVPTKANAVGEKAGLILTAGNWFLDTGATAANEQFRIVDVLDANRNSILDPRFSGNAGVHVVAEVLQSQMTVVTDPAA